MSPDASRVYFTTAAKLEASDTNGATDLYVSDRGQLTRITDGVVTAPLYHCYTSVTPVGTFLRTEPEMIGVLN